MHIFENDSKSFLFLRSFITTLVSIILNIVSNTSIIKDITSNISVFQKIFY